MAIGPGLRWNGMKKLSINSLIKQPSRSSGFTMVELVMVIVLLGILSAVAVSKWPTGMKEEAARRELKRAFRYAQHKAITRNFDPDVAPWGLAVSGNRYTVERADHSEQAEEEYRDRFLLGDSDFTLTGPASSVFFNGLGEPIKSDGSFYTAADNRTFTTAGLPLTFCPETGYVQEGTTCP